MISDALGDVMPQAMGLALSPMPIIAVVLMLTSQGGKLKGLLFALGGYLGMLVAALLLTRAGGEATPKEGDPSTIASVIQLAMGLLFFFLAVKQWTGRPKAGEPAEKSGLLTKLDSAGPLLAFVFGAAMMVINPKNLSILVAAGLSLAQTGLSGSTMIVAVAVFCLFAAGTLLLPALAALILGEKADPALRSIGDWLSANSSTIMLILFLVLGAKMLGQGLGGILGS